MTTSNFNSLSLPQKLSVVACAARSLGLWRLSRPYQVFLFAMENFYVELWFNHRTEALEKAEAFTGEEKLQRYLPAVNPASAYVPAAATKRDLAV